MLPPFHATPLAVAPELEHHAAAALHALEVVRFAPQADLLAAFGSDGLTASTVDTWVAAGIVHRGRVVADPVNATELAYLAVTVAGARALATVSGKPATGIRPSTLRRSTATRSHEVAKGAVALAFLALEREGRVSLIGIQADDKKLAMSVTMKIAKGTERVGLQPDLLVVIRRDRGNVGLIFEVDRGTVSAPTRMGAKYRAYLAWKAAAGPLRDLGLRAVRIVTVVPTDRRLTRLHDVALEATRGKRSGFLTFAHQERFSSLAPAMLLAPIARITAPGEATNVPLVTP
jgi:hypothetical protein